MSVLRKYNIQQGIKRPKLYVYISDNQIHITSNLPGTLKICIRTRLMFNASINTTDFFHRKNRVHANAYCLK